MIQAVRGYMTANFVLKEKWLNRYLIHPAYTSHKILGEECVVFFRKTEMATMDKAYAVGFTILDKSKWFMCAMYYNFIQPRLGGYKNAQVRLLFCLCACAQVQLSLSLLAICMHE